MSQDLLRYEQIVQDALRGVVRTVLTRVARDGMPGDHHFYITFRTGHPGVTLPQRLRETYPEEMTIVLQHQFFGLELKEDAFEVTLSFNRRLERLRVPYAAVTAFVDPSVNFGLQFQSVAQQEEHEPHDSAENDSSEQGAASRVVPGDGSNVVNVDFGKKK